MRQNRPMLAICIIMCLLFSLSPGAEAAMRMYWTDPGYHNIKRANTDGTNIEVLIPWAVEPGGIALDVAGGKMYWVDSYYLSNSIQRANLDGTNVEVLVESVGASAISLDIAGGKMYWTDIYITGWIQRANLDGTNVENLVTWVGDREGLALDVVGGKMYWTQRAINTIYRANLDGTEIEDLGVAGLIDPRGIALDVAGGKMYWTDAGTRKIQRANLDGTDVEGLVTGLGSPNGIALDVPGGKMYWTDFYTQKIQRANLDGSSVEDLVTTELFPSGIAIESFATGVEVPIDIKPSSDTNCIKQNERGAIPVAIFGSADLDVTQIDIESLSLQGLTVKMAGKSNKYLAHYDYANDDSHLDLIVQFQDSERWITSGNGYATLRGKLKNGTPIEGKDTIYILP